MASSGSQRRLPRVATHSPQARAARGPPFAPRAARLAGYLFALSACALLLLAAAWWQGLTSANARHLAQSWLASTRASISRCANGLSVATDQLWAHRPTRATLRAADAAQRGVPIISADAAGLFRIAFGSVVLACVMLEPMEPSHLNGYDVGGAQGVYGTFIGWLRASPPQCSRSVRGCWRSAACSLPASRRASAIWFRPCLRHVGLRARAGPIAPRRVGDHDLR